MSEFPEGALKTIEQMKELYSVRPVATVYMCVPEGVYTHPSTKRFKSTPGLLRLPLNTTIKWHEEGSRLYFNFDEISFFSKREELIFPFSSEYGTCCHGFVFPNYWHAYAYILRGNR